jgi:hypothetical protein
MKCTRFLLVFSLVFLLPIILTAQTDRSFGVKGGFMLSNFWGSGTDNLNSSVRQVITDVDERNLKWFCVSAFSSHSIIPDLASIQSELVYYRGGKFYKGTFGGAEHHPSIEVDYLALPIMLKIHFPFPLKPSVYVGPQISWMFRSRVHNFPSTLDTTAFFEGTTPSQVVFNSHTNVVDLGFVAGLDFGIPFGPGDIVLDGRYQLGALDVFNYAAGRKVRNYAFLFMVGYAFNFGATM